MASYTVTGHPIGGLAQNGLPEALRDLLEISAVGTTIVITLSGPDDTKAKGHGVIK